MAALHEDSLGDAQRLAESHDDEVLEDLVHVDQECRCGDASMREIERRDPGSAEPTRQRAVAHVSGRSGDRRQSRGVVLERAEPSRASLRTRAAPIGAVVRTGSRNSRAMAALSSRFCSMSSVKSSKVTSTGGARPWRRRSWSPMRHRPRTVV